MRTCNLQTVNMGCNHSKTVEIEISDNNQNSKEENEMENVGNRIPLDSRIPLDARQVFKIKQSWKAVKRNLEETGIEMFIK